LKEVLEENKGTLAFGDIRIGEIILIIDCDTRIPEDCLLDAVNEFHEIRDVAILQHKSAGMRAAHSYQETGILLFTQLNYAVTTFVAAAGKMGLFLGYVLFNIIYLTLVTTPLSVGRYCNNCRGLKTANSNGGQNFMCQRILSCLSACKLLDGGCDM